MTFAPDLGLFIWWDPSSRNLFANQIQHKDTSYEGPQRCVCVLRTWPWRGGKCDMHLFSKVTADPIFPRNHLVLYLPHCYSRFGALLCCQPWPWTWQKTQSHMNVKPRPFRVSYITVVRLSLHAGNLHSLWTSFRLPIPLVEGCMQNRPLCSSTVSSEQSKGRVTLQVSTSDNIACFSSYIIKLLMRSPN